MLTHCGVCRCAVRNSVFRREQAYRFSRSDSRSESSGGSGGGDRNRLSGEALPSTLVVPPP